MDAHRIFVNAGALMEATDAQSDDRRVRPRDRPHRRRPPVEDAPGAGQRADRVDRRHAARRRRRWRRAHRAAISTWAMSAGALFSAPQSLASALAARLSARPGRIRPTAPACDFLTMTGQSAKGMYDTFKRFADESLVRGALRSNPMCRTIPMPRGAHGGARPSWRSTPYWDKKDPPELQFRHDMMRAKLYGFIERPDTVLRRYPVVRYQPAGALRARHLRLPVRRPAQRHRADRRPDRGDAEQSLFLRAQGPGAARRRHIRPKRSRRCAAPCSSRPIRR